MLDQRALRSRILETTNMMIALEGGPVPVSDVRIVSAPMFFDQTYGTSMLMDDGQVVLRVSVGRPVEGVADTVIHETAHVLLGVEHIDKPDHGETFQGLYRRLREKYYDVVVESLNGG